MQGYALAALATGLVLTLWPCVPAGAGESGPAVVIREGARPIFEYRHSDVPFKPYVKQFFTPAGVNMLRDAPHDHLHHHALMFAVGIDGVDFWSEVKGCGRQVHGDVQVFGTVRGGQTVMDGLRDGHLAWNTAAGETLATEARAVRMHDGRELGASLLTWRTALKPAQGKASIKVHGSHYFGLGMRLVESMDNVGTFSAADRNEPGETVRGDERLRRGRWCAYTAPVDGKPVTVAMFDHPKNPRPAWWFTMTKPFAYLSATLNLHREPLIVKADETLLLRYGVAAWDGGVDAKRIDDLYARWLVLVDKGEKP